MNNELLQQILSEMKDLKNVQLEMKADMQVMKNEQKLMKVQLDEHTQLFRAVLDRQEETDAKLEALSMDVHKLHGKVEENSKKLDALAEDQKSIHEILGDHEVSIRTLRRKPV